MKNLFLLVIALSVTVAVNAQKGKTAPKAKITAAPAMKNLIDSFSYAAGVNIGRNMKDQGITQLNTSLMLQALNDVINGKAVSMNADVASSCLQRQMEVFSKVKADQEKAGGLAFLEANKKNKDVVVLPDGLQYQVIKMGEASANKPKPEDTVVVNYIGAFIDGKEFDNSFKRGQAAVFPVGGVIRGWTEILQLMPVGSHWKVFIPSELGYGEQGMQGAIPPYSVLVFDITLEGIKPAAVNPKQ